MQRRLTDTSTLSEAPTCQVFFADVIARITTAGYIDSQLFTPSVYLLHYTHIFTETSAKI